MKKLPLYKNGPVVEAFTDAELPRLQTLFNVAYKIWNRDMLAGGGDCGTCVIGAGFAVYHAPPRVRYARTKIVVSPPGQGDCQWCAAGAEKYLTRHGIQTIWKYGRMD